MAPSSKDYILNINDIYIYIYIYIYTEREREREKEREIERVQAGCFVYRFLNRKCPPLFAEILFTKKILYTRNSKFVTS